MRERLKKTMPSKAHHEILTAVGSICTQNLLLPIAFAVVGAENMNSLTIVTASILAGAVCGDHASPISDTTILASAGAQCHHIDHVSTQIPYVIVVATCSFFGYIVDGLTENGWLGLLTGLICLAIAMIYIRAKVPVLDR